MQNRRPQFTKKLIIWYLENKRSLPWRQTFDPYTIWLSEIILQQTRVSQGLPYFERFVERFPTVYDLAKASENDVLKLWQGLGYYSRARNLHATAKEIVHSHNGNFPSTYNELLKLKGVGDYTASAIASICYDEPTAVVDGNVYRVLSRVFGIETPVNTTAGFREFKELAQALLDESAPGTFNQALMEFGAQYCVPSNPDCPECIFQNQCYASSKGKVKELPVKRNKTKIRLRYLNYLVLLDSEGNTYLEKRTGKGIWRNLYQFPVVESDGAMALQQLKKEQVLISLSEELPIVSIYSHNDELVEHKLSHQHLKIRFWIVEVADAGENFIDREELLNHPVPVVIANFISRFTAFQL